MPKKDKHRKILYCMAIIIIWCLVFAGFANPFSVSTGEAVVLRLQSFDNPIFGQSTWETDSLSAPRRRDSHTVGGLLSTTSEFYLTYDEVEPNNSIQEANLVNAGYYGQNYYDIIGTITTVNTDLDFFRFDVTVNGIFDIVSYWTGSFFEEGHEGDISVALMDAGGNIVATSVLRDPGPLAFQYLKKGLNPGTYYIRFSETSGHPNRYVGESYLIDVQFYPNYSTVSTPAIPMGTGEGVAGYSYTYTTGGSECSVEGEEDLDHDVEYRFDWGDGSYSDWNASPSAAKIWPFSGTYQVKAQARCAEDTYIESSWSSEKTVVILDEYTISVAASPPAGGTLSGGGLYVHGESVTVIATAAEGYQFVNWTEYGIEVSPDSSYNFTADRDRSLVANFQLKEYSISLSANPEEGGTVNGGSTYAHGSEITVTASPEDGYQFVNWTEDSNLVSTDASYTFSVDRERILVANFYMDTVNIILNSNPPEGGTVSGSGAYGLGLSVTVEATPHRGYRFSHWAEGEDIISLSRTYTFTADRDRSLTAAFDLYGDVANTGTVDVGDAILVLRHIVGLINLETAYGPDALARAKVGGGGGDIDVGDAILILRYIVGLITEFPVEVQ